MKVDLFRADQRLVVVDESPVRCIIFLVAACRAISSTGARGARSPRYLYDVIVVVTSSATELATRTVADVRTPYRVKT